jgi:hypothetical protein
MHPRSILHVCFTMDVERIKAESPCGGPPTWEFAELSVRSYCEFLKGEGYPASLFIVPDTAAKQAHVFQELHRDGHECGLHLHPQCWRDNYRQMEAHDYLGGYPAEEQFRILGQARDQWAEAVGWTPAAFRSGNFSANDSTFSVLAALRFKCGSVSQPGRFAPQCKAVWTGAVRGVHRAHKCFRLLEGDLDFVEIPPTVDTTRTDHWTGVGDARLEDWEAPDILNAIADSLKWQQENSTPIKHICLFTHNYVNYSPEDVAVPAVHRNIMVGKSRRPVVKGVLAALPRLAEPYGLDVKGCTLSQLREHYLASGVKA